VKPLANAVSTEKPTTLARVQSSQFHVPIRPVALVGRNEIN
jgi:hypothetical protein